MTAGKYLLAGLRTILHAASCSLIVFCCSQAAAEIPVQEIPAQTVKPITYRDTNSGITLHLESDGRRIVATNSLNEKMWQVDPFSDAKLTPYRTAYPVVVYIGKIAGRTDILPSERAAAIRFNSTQFGKINLDTGHFVLLGQD